MLETNTSKIVAVAAAAAAAAAALWWHAFGRRGAPEEEVAAPVDRGVPFVVPRVRNVFVHAVAVERCQVVLR